jgi:hypothetical protein
VVAEMADDIVLFGDGRIVDRRSNAVRKPPLELRW